MSEVDKSLTKECKDLLLNAKEDILNRVQSTKENLNTAVEKGGDEGDQTVRALAESEMLGMHDRLRKQLLEVEYALVRIDAGSFGLCEETEEPIEPERLRAIPWTRLSIEGAEIRESHKKRFAGR
jgi:DnaK suppressor protein